MATIELDIQDTGGRVTTVQAHEDMSLADVAILAREGLGLPLKDHQGRELRYALFHNNEGRFLNLDLAVHGIGGGRLRILPRAFTDLFELELLSEPNPGMLYPLQAKELSVGRDFSNNIVIRHKVVSRQHGVFTWEAGFHLYLDLGSANGSWINNYPVTQPIPIANGDILNLGQSVTLIYRERQSTVDATTTVEADLAIANIKTEPSRTGLVQIPKGELLISYSPGQQHLMEVISNGLSRTGLKIWVNPDDLTDAIQRCIAMVVILSREAVSDENLWHEWEEFYAHRKPIIPVLFEPCRVPSLFDDAPAIVEYHQNDQILAGDVLHALYQALA